MTPHVWFVVINYNGLADTKTCLASLRSLSYPRVSIVLVDNGSAEDPTDAARACLPWCDVVRHPVNSGFAGGANIGLAHALERGADWVVFLNNDTVVSPDIVTRLVTAAAANPDYGVIGPVITFMDEPDVVMTDGVTFNPPGFNGFFQRRAVELTPAAPTTITEVDIVNGCCMMVAAQVFRRIGTFDERFFAYHEESDFCLRAAEAGFKLGIVGLPLVQHKGSASFKRVGLDRQRYYDTRNLALLLWKQRWNRRRRRGLPVSMFTYLKYAFYRYCIEREHGEDGAADAVLMGLCDAALWRYGPMRRALPWAVGPLRSVFELARHRPRSVLPKGAA